MIHQTSLIVWLLISLQAWADHAQGPDGNGRSEASDSNRHPTEVCKNVYPMTSDRTIPEATTDFKPNTVYETFNSVARSFVYVLTDNEGKLDNRPLGVGSIIACKSLGSSSLATNEGYCELGAAGWKAVPTPVTGLTHISRLTPKLNGDEFFWEESLEQNAIPSRAATATPSNARSDGSAKAPSSNASRPPEGVQTDASGKKYSWVQKGEKFLKQYEGFELSESPPGSGKFYQVPANHRLVPANGGEPWLVPPGKQLITAKRSDGGEYKALISDFSVGAGYPLRPLNAPPGTGDIPAQNSSIESQNFSRRPVFTRRPTRVAARGCPPGVRG